MSTPASLRLDLIRAAQAQAAADAQVAPPPVHPDDPLRIPRWIALGASGLADGLTTRAAIRRGATETNPFMAPFAKSDAGMLLGKLLFNGLVGWSADQQADDHPGRANALAGLASLVQLLAAYHNAKVAR